MSQSVRFAIALVVLWLAFASFFVAFHPGGLQVNGKPAQNPTDVFKYLIQRMANPSTGGTAGASNTTEQPAQGGTQNV